MRAILAALFMGTMGIFSRKSGQGAEVVSFFRLFLGAAFLFLFICITGRLRKIQQKPEWNIVFSGLMLAGLIIFYTRAMNLTTLANAVMLLYLAPLAASVFAHSFLKERLNSISISLILLSLFGFAMMMEFRIDFSAGSDHLAGLFSGLISMFCYAAFIIINRTIDRKTDVFISSFYQMSAGAGCLLPFLLFSIPTISLQQWSWLVGAVFFPGFLGILAAVIALRQLKATTFSTLAYLEPISVVSYGWFFFGETLSLLQICGCLLILLTSIVKTCTMST
ncbi:DMT family transporter [Desulfomarina sp.]